MPRALRRFDRKTRVLLIVLVIANTCGNALLGLGLRQAGGFACMSLEACLHVAGNPAVDIAIAMLAASTAAEMAVLSWADLSYVLPVTAAGYALTALAGTVLLHEHISALHWGAIGLITSGVALVAPTPSATSDHTWNGSS